MDPNEWKERYIKRLMERGGLTREEAEDNFDAAYLAKAPGVWWEEDFEEDPEFLADEEMSYWTD